MNGKGCTRTITSWNCETVSKCNLWRSQFCNICSRTWDLRRNCITHWCSCHRRSAVETDGWEKLARNLHAVWMGIRNEDHLKISRREGTNIMTYDGHLRYSVSTLLIFYVWYCHAESSDQTEGPWFSHCTHFLLVAISQESRDVLVAITC